MSEQTITAVVQSLGSSSPWFVLVIGILVIATGLAIKIYPLWYNIQVERLHLDREKETRHQEEVKISAQFLEQTKRSNVATESLATQTAVLSAQLEASMRHSEDMGEKVDDIHDTTKAMKVQVNDIHTAIIKHQIR